MHQAVRTQIYLPQDLRREIDSVRKWKEESLSDYLRQAAKERLEKDKKKKNDLKKLAEGFIGSSKRSDKEIQEWLDWVRKERKLSDQVREERLEKSTNSK